MISFFFLRKCISDITFVLDFGLFRWNSIAFFHTWQAFTVSMFKMRSLVVWLFLYILQFALFSCCDAISAQVNHNSSWQPQYVLVATAETIDQNCQTRRSVVFNGTFPGPTIYLREEKTTWVRVYNRIPNKNLTVVSAHQNEMLTDLD